MPWDGCKMHWAKTGTQFTILSVLPRTDGMSALPDAAVDHVSARGR